MFNLKSVIGRISLLAAGALLLGTSIFAQKTEAFTVVLPHPTFFVSPSGDNTDGSSWQHAFSDLNQIKWSSIHPGDLITIDGGQGNWNNPVNYYHGLVVPAGAPGCSISLSTEPFHNGAARIYAPAGRVTQAGITILSSNPVSISGQTAYGLQLANFPVGVSVQRGSVSLDFLQIIGPSSAGAPPSSATQSSAILASGASSVTVNRTAAFNYRYSAVCHERSTLNVFNSWLYNYSWPGAGAVAGGVFNQDGANTVTVTNCVLGPGLNYGVANCRVPGLIAEASNSSTVATSVNNCLLIQPALQGLATLAEGKMYCSHVTEFKTSRNPYRGVGNCVASTTPLTTGMTVGNSIICGGIVEVPAFAHPLTDNNTQFNTSGNTRFLSSSESNPQFLTVQPSMPNPTNILQWINMDFSSRRHTTTGEGSTFNSINQLLNSWYYSAVAYL